jgi:hypothetical protein
VVPAPVPAAAAAGGAQVGGLALRPILDDGRPEMVLRIQVGAISSTDALLQAAFDACAEAVGAVLETSSKRIILRYVCADVERKLNTKVRWEVGGAQGKLKGAEGIIIKGAAARCNDGEQALAAAPRLRPLCGSGAISVAVGVRDRRSMSVREYN